MTNKSTNMKKLLILFVTLSLTACNELSTVTSAAETSAFKSSDSNGEPSGPHTSAEWKIWAYSTAAPSFIAAD